MKHVGRALRILGYIVFAAGGAYVCSKTLFAPYTPGETPRSGNMLIFLWQEVTTGDPVVTVLLFGSLVIAGCLLAAGERLEKKALTSPD